MITAQRGDGPRRMIMIHNDFMENHAPNGREPKFLEAITAITNIVTTAITAKRTDKNDPTTVIADITGMEVITDTVGVGQSIGRVPLGLEALCHLPNPDHGPRAWRRDSISIGHDAEVDQSYQALGMRISKEKRNTAQTAVPRNASTWIATPLLGENVVTLQHLIPTH